jgi:uncharacterized OB-fold protein
MSEKPFRVLPRVTKQNGHFWRGGEQGELRFLRCRACRTYVHPPAPVCPECLGRDLAPEAVSGRATVLTYTLNHQPWVPSADHPYCIAIVGIEEQEGLRLMTNVVHCPPEDVRIGMPVRVVFEQHEDVWIPLFEPAEGQGRRPRSEPQASGVQGT